MRQKLAAAAVKLQFGGYFFARAFRIAGQHLKISDAGTAQFPYCLCGLRFNTVAANDTTGITPAVGKEYLCSFDLGDGSRLLFRIAEDEQRGTGRKLLSVPQHFNTGAGFFRVLPEFGSFFFKHGCFLFAEPPLNSAFYRNGNRMAGMIFGDIGKLKQFLRAELFCRKNMLYR